MKFKFYQPQAINEMGARKNQEDTVYPAPKEATADSRLFIVCDGMGGYEKGEVASSTVATAISRHVSQWKQRAERLESAGNSQSAPLSFTDADFDQAINAAYKALDDVDQQQEGKMGTTLTMLCFHRGGCLAAHIGDSRIYHIRPKTGEILYRSRDHSLVHQLYEMGELQYHEMKTSPKKNIVMRAMQPHQESRAKAELVHITDIRPGDYFYLCTDGMLERMDDDEILEIVCDKQADDTQKRQTLVERTANNADNHSAYLIHIQGVESEESDTSLTNDEPQARAANKALNDPMRNARPEVEAEVSIDNTSRQTQQQATRATAQRRPAQRQQGSTAKKLIMPLVIMLVAIIAGFTIFNMLSAKKSSPERNNQPAVETNDDREDRVEFKSGTTSTPPPTGYTPVRPASNPAQRQRDKQSDDVDNILKDAERREQDKSRAIQEKAAQAEKEKQAEEARKKAQQSQQTESGQQGQKVPQPDKAEKSLSVKEVENAYEKAKQAEKQPDKQPADKQHQ